MCKERPPAEYTVRSAFLTDIGRLRLHNQDSVFAADYPVGPLPNLYLVADGMGGHRGGDFASRFTIDTIVEDVEEGKYPQTIRLLGKAIERANRDLREQAFSDVALLGCGTTVVAAVIEGNVLTFANVGDSRGYLIRAGKIHQITRDHSLVEEMVRAGELTKEAARTHPERNIITRAIGAQDYVHIDFFEEELRKGDLVLMCSDGLTTMVEDGEILKLCQAGDLNAMVKNLVRTANEHGGKDNISVLLIDPFDFYSGLSQ
ncbi:MAG: Stp1/IreP family PP2C-type Ser/Thr phosphatase [Lachnospiraceae bacterium]|nr:Stp1/IreP family PP2C-type Ser/Thr phosphatase [Lachnospiraceae bacterium]